MNTAPRFALLGAAGYIAPRHLAAIKSVGGVLLAAHDPHDSVGILDAYFPQAAFFTEIERFDRHLDKLARRGEGIDYLVVCSPNHLHDAHCRLGLRLGADVICEKPVTLNPWNLDGLQVLERETGKRIWCILQSRLHPSYAALQVLAKAASPSQPSHIDIQYITPRGPWYRFSWKGQDERSGGIVTNIGIHLFDVVVSTFGSPTSFSHSEMGPERAQGRLLLASATVDWRLSVSADDLPMGHQGPWREFRVDGQALNFSSGFDELHNASYANILAGSGFGLQDARDAIVLVSKMRAVGK